MPPHTVFAALALAATLRLTGAEADADYFQVRAQHVAILFASQCDTHTMPFSLVCSTGAPTTFRALILSRASPAARRLTASAQRGRRPTPMAQTLLASA